MPEKFDRCVQHVKEQGGKANPYAVCHASLGKELTKEDENKLGQILKGLNEMRDIIKGGEKSKENPFKQFNDAKAASKMKPVKPIKIKR